MPRSFLVKNARRFSSHSSSGNEQSIGLVAHYIKEEKEHSQFERRRTSKKSAFVSFSNSTLKETREYDDRYLQRVSVASKIIPSSSPLTKCDISLQKVSQIPQLEPISVIYTDRVTSMPKCTEKENMQGNKSGCAKEMASVKGPLSKSHFLCQLCKKLFQDPFSLAQHKCSGIKHVEHRCPECNKVFSCPANLASHRRWHRPRSPGSNKPMKMQKRSSSTGSDSSYSKDESNLENSNENHKVERKISREKSYNESDEELPNLVDKNNNQLEEFLFTESSESIKHVCSHCGKGFKRQAYLRKHMNYHNNAKPYPCQFCGKIFRSQTNRAKHVLNHAVGPNACTCSVCGNGFANRFELEKHSRIHSGEVFGCDVCSISFYSLPGLQRHKLKAHQSISPL